MCSELKSEPFSTCSGGKQAKGQKSPLSIAMGLLMRDEEVPGSGTGDRAEGTALKNIPFRRKNGQDAVITVG